MCIGARLRYEVQSALLPKSMDSKHYIQSIDTRCLVNWRRSCGLSPLTKGLGSAQPFLLRHAGTIARSREESVTQPQ